MKKTLIITFLLVALGGCESLDSMNKRRLDMSKETQDKFNQITNIPTNSNTTAHFSNDAYIGNANQPIKYINPLPPIFGQKININIGDGVALNEIAEIITQQYALKVSILDKPDKPEIINLSISDGKLSSLLDIVATKNNMNWRYQNGGIEFYKYLTKTFKIHALPGTSELSASVGSDISGGNQQNGSGAGVSSSAGTSSDAASGNGSNTNKQSTSIDAAELSVWKDLQSNIESMLTPGAGKVFISQSAGTATITDTPQAVNRIEQFIEDNNKIISKQVVIHYRVLAVDQNDAARMGLNWTAVFNSMNQNYSINIASMALPQAAAGSAILSALIPRTASGTMGQLAGSSILIDAISQQGRVSQVYSGAVTTLNNQPAPVYNQNEQYYIANVPTSLVTNVGAATGVQQSKISVGFSMNLMPHILDDDRVLLQYSINLSNLRNYDETTVNGIKVKSPNQDKNGDLGKISMHAGDTLMLSGFEKVKESSSNFEGIFGGGQDAKEDKTIIVILITPILTDG